MRRSRPERALLLVVMLAAAPLAAQPKGGADDAGNPLGFGAGIGGKEPITITSDRLEYDYKNGIVVYRGNVEVVQGPTTVKSDTLTVTLAQDKGKNGKPDPAALEGTDPKSGDASTRVQQIVAVGSVRIDQGERYATGGRATFDQTKRTAILTDDPVLHDGPNEVMGDRVVVYLDENRSVVEGGRKRVKAVLYPDKDKAGEGRADGKPEAKKSADARSPQR
jgi:lipopolysaccharide export system protein LptA